MYVGDKRHMILKIEKQLKEWGCKYTSLRVGDKPHYDVWIDDKAVWSEEYFRIN